MICKIVHNGFSIQWGSPVGVRVPPVAPSIRTKSGFYSLAVKLRL